MCGIAGFIETSDVATENLYSVLHRMVDKMSTRGPDDSGVWLDERFRIGLAHRRLAIQDCTTAGSQPMFSETGRYVISYNGEIYNHNEIRHKVFGQTKKWKGHSDTETLLESFEAIGIRETICCCVGMFAIALWDRQEAKLHLIRDRIGEKPLYWASREGSDKAVVFGSDLRALRCNPFFSFRIDEVAIKQYLRQNFFSGTESIYKGINKLNPGSILTFGHDGAVEKHEHYWLPKSTWIESNNKRKNVREQEVVQEFEQLFSQSIKGQMLGDVPIGAFLSGGVDSSLVVAFMQKFSATPIKTFNVAMKDRSLDESSYARRIANHLGTDHHCIEISDATLAHTVCSALDAFGEPLGDSSAIPTFVVARCARSHVTVTLSGDGGDEVFGGYNRYVHYQAIQRHLALIPPGLKEMALNLMHGFPVHIFEAILRRLPGRAQRIQVANALKKIRRVSKARTYEELYQAYITHNDNAIDCLSETFRQSLSKENKYTTQLDFVSGLDYMMLRDLSEYLPNDVLNKVDRACMHVSLESRAPFLDHRIVEFGFSLPTKYKITGIESKKILNTVLEPYVPRVLRNPAKTGFTIPLDSWLRGPLKTWASDLLEGAQFKSAGIFDQGVVRQMWADHLDGSENLSEKLWSILSLLYWLEREK